MSLLQFLRPSYWAGSTAQTCVEADTLCRATDAAGLGQYHLPQMLQNLLSGISSATGGYVSPMTTSVATTAVLTGATVLAIRQLRTDVAKIVTKDLFEAIKGDADLLAKFKALEANKAVLAQLKGLTKSEATDFAAKMKEGTFAQRFVGFNEQQQVGAVKGFKEARAKRLAQEQEAKKAEALQAKQATGTEKSRFARFKDAIEYVRPSAFKWDNSYLNPWAYNLNFFKKADTTTTPVTTGTSTVVPTTVQQPVKPVAKPVLTTTIVTPTVGATVEVPKRRLGGVI
jgi:hypothetical protein